MDGNKTIYRQGNVIDMVKALVYFVGNVTTLKPLMAAIPVQGSTSGEISVTTKNATS